MGAPNSRNSLGLEINLTNDGHWHVRRRAVDAHVGGGPTLMRSDSISGITASLSDAGTPGYSSVGT